MKEVFAIYGKDVDQCGNFSITVLVFFQRLTKNTGENEDDVTKFIYSLHCTSSEHLHIEVMLYARVFCTSASDHSYNT